MDKKEEQGQLGEAFDAALEAVINGDDQEVVPSEGDCRDRKGDSAMRSEAYNLAGTLRHVWFDFHHEVQSSSKGCFLFGTKGLFGTCKM